MEIGSEGRVKWKDYLTTNGQMMLAQLGRLRSVKITLIGNKGRLKGRGCYGEIDDEHIKAIDMIADPGIDITIHGVCLRKTRASAEAGECQREPRASTEAGECSALAS